MATRSDDPEYAADAAFTLGQLRFERRDLPGARAALVIAAELDHEPYSGKAREILEIFDEPGR